MLFTKDSLINFLIQALLFSTLVFTIAYFFVGYLSIPTSNSEPLRDLKFIYENKVLIVYAITNGALLISLYLVISEKFKTSYLILFSVFLLALAILFNGSFPSPMFYFSIFNTYMVFYILLRSNIKFTNISKITLWIFILYIVIPILIVLADSWANIIINQIPPLFIFDSFRGFTFDRIEYAILAGYLLLILTIHEKKYFLIVPFIIYGILIAESRAIIVSLLFSYIYFFRKNTKFLLILVFLIIFIFLIFSSISNRTEMADDGGRFDFYIASLSQIFNNPLSILVGVGQYYTPVEKYSVVPHNFIIQTLLNFGFIVFAAWSLIIINTWNKVNDQGRVFLLYSLTVGLFHPGYDAFMYLPFSALGYYLAILYGLKKYTTINHKVTRFKVSTSILKE